MYYSCDLQAFSFFGHNICHSCSDSKKVSNALLQTMTQDRILKTIVVTFLLQPVDVVSTEQEPITAPEPAAMRSSETDPLTSPELPKEPTTSVKPQEPTPASAATSTQLGTEKRKLVRILFYYFCGH